MNAKTRLAIPAILALTALTAAAACDSEDHADASWRVEDAYANGNATRYEVAVGSSVATVDVTQLAETTAVVVHDADSDTTLHAFGDADVVALAHADTDDPGVCAHDEVLHDLASAAVRDGGLPMDDEFRFGVPQLPGLPGLPALGEEDDEVTCEGVCEWKRKLCIFANSNQVLGSSPIFPCDLFYYDCMADCADDSPE